MQWFIAVVIVAALGVVAVVAAGGFGEMKEDPVRDYYRQDLPTERPLNAAEIEGVRFAVTIRGYSMAQVDDLLERLSAEIADRDEELHRLRSGASGETEPENREPENREPEQDRSEPDESRSAERAAFSGREDLQP